MPTTRLPHSKEHLSYEADVLNYTEETAAEGGDIAY